MVSCLHMAAGRFHLLMEACRVREVLDPADLDPVPEHGGRLLWRGSVIQALDARVLLGEADSVPPCGAVVCDEQEGAEPVLVLCDRVYGLQRADERDLRPMPPTAGPIMAMAGRVMADPAGTVIMYLLKQGGLRQRMDHPDGGQTVPPGAPAGYAGE